MPPGRYFARIPVARLLSDHDLTLAAHILRGTRDGPILGLLAGVHGDETPGARCIRDLLTGLSPDELAGAVVAIPVANPLAWQAQQRTTPERDVDQANLARVFNAAARYDPEQPGGSLTRRLAAALEETLFAAVTHLIDYHCFGRDTAVRLMLYRTGQTETTLETSRAMATAFGLGVVQGVAGSTGTTSALAAARAIPTCVAEMGGRLSRVADDYFAALGVAGARRVMQRLGMLTSAPAGAKRQLTVERLVTVAPRTSGYYLPTFDLEDLAHDAYPHGIPVQAGQPLGTVFDPYTLQLVETLTAPEDGYLVLLGRGGPFQVGGLSLGLVVGSVSATD